MTKDVNKMSRKEIEAEFERIGGLKALSDWADKNADSFVTIDGTKYLMLTPKKSS